MKQHDQEQGEEESPTTDVEDNPVTRPTGVEALLENMRMDQSRAIAGERWHEASEIQQAICWLQDATAGDQPEGLSQCDQECIPTIVSFPSKQRRR